MNPRGRRLSCSEERGLAALLLVLLLFFSCRPVENGVPAVADEKVRLGVKVFLENRLEWLEGKRVGLITNPTGIDSELRSTAELFREKSNFRLVALYGPEHGVRGDAQPGLPIPFYIDKKYGLPVFSLYGQTKQPEPGMLKNIDEYMRSFDTTDEGKRLEDSMVEDVEVIVFDIQDVGTRVYTYIATMAYAMKACASAGIPFVVLDRPNPVTGVLMEGPVLEYPEFSSFLGVYPIPLRHGLTAGELALLFNERYLERKVSLTVVPMEGWERGMWFDETGLSWIIPSPNMPTLDTTAVYPGQVLLEGTNISEGRGTTRPFELFGAPWIDAPELVGRLNGLVLPGVVFREAWFTPTFSKYQGERCGGAQVHVTDRDAFRPVETTLHIIKTVMDMSPRDFEFHASYFDTVTGTSRVRIGLENGTPVKEIVKSFDQDLKDFEKLRAEFLLYGDSAKGRLPGKILTR